MANCALCSSELKFLNTPTFGAGKLNDGNTICTSCFAKISKAKSQVTFKLKEYSTNDLLNILDEKNESDKQKETRFEEIKEQIKNLKLSGIDSFLGRREIKELPKILATSELVENLAQGVYHGGQGILVATDRRLLFIDKGMIYGLKVEDFPLDKISSIQYTTGLLTGEIKIHTFGNIATIQNVDKKIARSFSEFVRDKLSRPTTSIENSNQPNTKDNLVEDLKKIKELFDSGILTETEYTEKKNLLIQKLGY